MGYVNLEDYTTNQLLEEIEKRKKKENKPKIIFSDEEIMSNIRSKVVPIVKDHIDHIDIFGNLSDDGDFEHYIYKGVIESLYGEKIWDWINNRQKI